MEKNKKQIDPEVRMCMPGCEDCEEGELQYFIFMEIVRPLRPLAHTQLWVRAH